MIRFVVALTYITHGHQRFHIFDVLAISVCRQASCTLYTRPLPYKFSELRYFWSSFCYFENHQAPVIQLESSKFPLTVRYFQIMFSNNWLRNCLLNIVGAFRKRRVGKEYA